MRSSKHLGIGWEYFLRERFCDVVDMTKLSNGNSSAEEIVEEL